MKPPIEYRPKRTKPKYALTGSTADLRAGPKITAVSGSYDLAGPAAALKAEPKPDYIVIRRNRAKYNAYMRAYRAKKRLEPK